MQPIKAELTNRTTKLSRPYPVELIDGLTSFSIPNVYFMPAFNRWRTVIKMVNGKQMRVQERLWDGKKHLLDKENDTLPTGLWLSIQPDLINDGHIPSKWKDRRIHPSTWYRKENLKGGELRNMLATRFPKARDYQIESAAAMIRNAKTGGLILSATGSGKTFLAGMVFTLLYDVDCLFVVDELTLLHQARKELHEVTQEDIGFVGEGRYEIGRITVATIQTINLHKHDVQFRTWLSKIGILVLDEIHVQMARRNFDVIETLTPPSVFGLTATLELKKKHIRLRAQALCGPVLYEYAYAQGAKEKVLAQGIIIRVVYPREAAIHKGTRWFQYDYHKLVSNSKRRNTLIEMLVRQALKENRKVILLVERVGHLKILAKRLKDLKPVTVWGAKESSERVKAQQDFEAGKIRLIIANKVFEKGVNIKSVDTGIDASAAKSSNKAMQKFGRFVRTCKGKQLVLYFDVSDKENRFEIAAKKRYRVFKKAQVPVVMVDAPEDFTEQEFDKWFQDVVRKAEKLAGSQNNEFLDSERSQIAF